MRFSLIDVPIPPEPMVLRYIASGTKTLRLANATGVKYSFDNGATWVAIAAGAKNTDVVEEYTFTSAQASVTVPAAVTRVLLDFSGVVGPFTTANCLIIAGAGLEHLDSWGTIKYKGVQLFNQQRLLSVPNTLWPACRTLQFMFWQAYLFNQDLRGWDTSEIESFNSVFNKCFIYNKPLDTWNLLKAKSTRWMFYRAEMFNQDISMWRFRDLTDMVQMFQMAYSFNQDLSPWIIPAGVNRTNYNQTATAWVLPKPTFL